MRGLQFLIITLIVTGCACGQKEAANQPPPKNLDEQLIQANKAMAEQEDEDINSYVDRAGWDMVTTGRGLRYWIYEEGEGEPGKYGQVAVFNYETKLITGKLCYSSDSTGTKQFLIGKGGVESGLEEAMLLLRKGDKAKIILPSHLAFGMVGDDNCIPKRATLIYDLEMLDLVSR